MSRLVSLFVVLGIKRAVCVFPLCYSRWKPAGNGKEIFECSTRIGKKRVDCDKIERSQLLFLTLYLDILRGPYSFFCIWYFLYFPLCRRVPGSVPRIFLQVTSTWDCPPPPPFFQVKSKKGLISRWRNVWPIKNKSTTLLGLEKLEDIVAIIPLFLPLYCERNWHSTLIQRPEVAFTWVEVTWTETSPDNVIHFLFRWLKSIVSTALTVWL